MVDEGGAVEGFWAGEGVAAGAERGVAEGEERAEEFADGVAGAGGDEV